MAGPRGAWRLDRYARKKFATAGTDTSNLRRSWSRQARGAAQPPSRAWDSESECTSCSEPRANSKKLNEATPEVVRADVRADGHPGGAIWLAIGHDR
jgi:hypothetical protein